MKYKLRKNDRDKMMSIFYDIVVQGRRLEEEVTGRTNTFYIVINANDLSIRRISMFLVTKRQTGAEIALLKPKISPMRKREFFLKNLK